MKFYRNFSLVLILSSCNPIYVHFAFLESTWLLEMGKNKTQRYKDELAKARLWMIQLSFSFSGDSRTVKTFIFLVASLLIVKLLKPSPIYLLHGWNVGYLPDQGRRRWWGRYTPSALPLLAPIVLVPRLGKVWEGENNNNVVSQASAHGQLTFQPWLFGGGHLRCVRIDWFN